METYVAYYGGSNRLDDLMKFDLVIIDADNYTAEEVNYLKSKGVVVLVYQSLGTIENWRWYWKFIQKEWILAPLNEWEGEWYINPCYKGWRDLLLNSILPRIIKKGFDGFLFDNIDIVDEYPETVECVIKLIKDIRKAYPDKVIVLNNPLTIISSIHEYIDGIMQEDVFLTYNWNKNRYVVESFNKSTSLIEKLKYWKNKGLKILILDYTDSQALAKYYYHKAKKYGFLYYACNIMLDKICRW